MFLTQEVEDEKYQILFGDGILGKKPENGSTLNITYIVTNGSAANGANNFNFAGYIEGNQLMNGDVNVIVSDGFTGNVALKTAEGTAKLVTYLLEKSFKSSIFSKIGYLFSKNGLKKMKDRVDPRKYNGAVLLGLNGIVVKSHGSTDPEGFSNAVKVGYEMVEGNFIKDLKSKISS